MTAAPEPEPDIPAHLRNLPRGWAERIRAEVDRAVEEHPFTPEMIARLRVLMRPTIRTRMSKEAK